MGDTHKGQITLLVKQVKYGQKGQMYQAGRNWTSVCWNQRETENINTVIICNRPWYSTEIHSLLKIITNQNKIIQTK